MAAMARNAVVLLVLVGVVVQLCSVVPPAAARPAGRVLQDVVQKPLVEGGLGGNANADPCVTGGGSVVGPQGQTLASGSLYCQRQKLVHQQGNLEIGGRQVVNTAPIP